MKRNIQKDLNRYINIHKYVIIATSLTTFEYEGIFDAPPFLKYKKLYKGEPHRSFKITDDLLNRTEHGEVDLFDNAYNICWQRLQPVID